MKITKAVIPAAGFGTRFLPQTKAMPKEMLPIVDKPVIQYVVEEAAAAGLQDIVLVTGWHKRAIEDHFDYPYELEKRLEEWGKSDKIGELRRIADFANFIYIRQKGPYGNATPIKSVEHVINKEPFLVLWGDDFVLATPSRATQLIEAYNKNEVSGVSSVSPQNLAKIKFKKRLNLMNLKMPRYFAVFFNQNQSSILSDKNVRLAINYGVSKENIISQVLSGNGAVVDSPMIGEVIDMPNGVKRYEYNPERALKLLAEAGWGNPDEKGILAKKEARLNLKLTTSPWPELTATANILKEQLLKIGINLDIEVLPTPALQQAIKDRNYQMLLFGEILTPDSDPFSLWHSSQKKDPGLNLALYDNKTADTILEEARQTLNPLERMKKYDDFQKIVIDDMPAVFLYNPFYVYGQSRRIKGYETKIISTPADRFSGITDWYVETERVWK